MRSIRFWSKSAVRFRTVREFSGPSLRACRPRYLSPAWKALRPRGAWLRSRRRESSSCSISWSLLLKMSGSMRTSVSCFWPFIFTVTMPPPAEASTSKPVDLLLELLLHLPELRQHLLKSFDFHVYSSPGRLTFEIWPPNFSKHRPNDRIFFEPGAQLRTSTDVVARPASSLTQTRSGWPTTWFNTVRKRSIGSRACNISASSAAFGGEKKTKFVAFNFPARGVLRPWTTEISDLCSAALIASTCAEASPPAGIFRGARDDARRQTRAWASEQVRVAGDGKCSAGDGAELTSDGAANFVSRR